MVIFPRRFLKKAWAQFGGGQGGRVPPLF